MANKVQFKAAGDQDFTDNDPFAELTRIMGFDPRVQPTPHPDDDFEIDLERELMGMFDPGADAPAGPAAQDLQDYPQEPVDNAPAVGGTAAEEIDDAFAARLEEELSGSADLWNTAQEDAAEGTEPADQHAYPEEPHDVLAEVDMDFGALQAEHSAQELEPDGGWTAERDADAGHSVQASMPDDGPEDRNIFRPAFFTPLDTDRPLAEESVGSEPAVAPIFDIRSFKSAAQQYREAQPRREAVVSDEGSANASAGKSPVQSAKGVDPFDILAALGTERGLPQRRDPLRGEDPAPKADDVEMPEQPAAVAVATPQEIDERETSSPVAAYTEEESQPVEASGERQATAVEALAATSEPIPFFNIRPAEMFETAGGDTDTGEAGYEFDAGPASASVKADAPEIDTTEIAEPAVAIADDLDIPVPAFQTEVRAAPVYDELDEEFEHAFQALSTHTEAIRQAAAEPEESSMAQTSAEIERLFAQELGIGSDMAVPAATVSAVAAGETAAGIEGAGDGIEEFEFEDSDFLPDEFAANASREIRDAFAADDAQAGNHAPWNARFPQGRGKLVAAVIAGVVVLGGIGAFAFSGNGSDTADKPVLLTADAHPVKVKPKNPGGMTVPNQDNKVYERVADGATAVAPEQKKLVSTEEQPVDISAQAKDMATALPGVFEGDQITSLKSSPSDEGVVDGGGAAGSSPDGSAAAAPKGDIADIIKAAPKGEDRLMPSQDAAPRRADNEILAVTPHKVKTMIVRADGTMVPREEPAAAEDALQGTRQDAVKTAEADTIISTDLPAAAPIPTQEPQAAAAPAAKAPEVTAPKSFERTDRGRIDTPAKVALAPSRPADQPQQVASAEPAPAPVTEASGNWSVQIASQPTAEAAQTTYQNMARRYADILGGHAANIVKADIAGKGTYYRVRIAAGSKEGAITLCTKYKAAGGSCFVSK